MMNMSAGGTGGKVHDGIEGRPAPPHFDHRRSPGAGAGDHGPFLARRVEVRCARFYGKHIGIVRPAVVQMDECARRGLDVASLRAAGS